MSACVRPGQPFPRFPPASLAPRLLAFLLLFAGAAAAAACGGSTAVETVVGPDAVRCQTSLAGPAGTVPPDGATVSVTISASRDCTWTAASEASWLQLNATSGQGDATLSITVARNDAGTARSGAVAVNNQRVNISQEARPCTFETGASPASFGANGGSGTLAIDTLPGCTWTAVSSTSWLRVAVTSGTGPATVNFEVSANDGSRREATIAVGGRSVTVAQGGPAPPNEPVCTATLNPSTITAAGAGGTHTVSLSIDPACDWTATSSASWLTVAPGTGRGNASLTVTAAQNTGSARSATVRAGGATATVNQAAAPTCTYSLQPTSQNFGAAGGNGQFTVTTQAGCTWTASSGANWTTVTSGSGSGNGTVSFSVQANTAASTRQTAISVGGQSFNVTQEAVAPTCTYTLQPTSQNFGAAGGTGQFTVTTQAGCSWTASSNATWTTVTSGSGSGSGTVSFSVQANTATSTRQTTISVGGQTFDVTQEAAAPTCTYTLQPTSQNFGASGGTGQFTVTTQAGCAWSASSGANWTTVTSGSGSGSGTVSFSVQANTATSTRQTTISVGGQTFDVTQEAAAPTCTYTLQPTSQNFAAAGGSGQFAVTTQAGCSWSASSGANWTTITSGSGSGNGTVSFSVQANTATSTRQTTISVGGQSFSVTQEAAPATCTYTLQPSSQNFGAPGGNGQFTVTTQAGCSWTASSGASWVSVTSGSGSGTGNVSFSVSSNTVTSTRSTVISVGGQTFTVTQDAPVPCTYSLQPTSQNFAAGGGNGSFAVTTQTGCSWSASSGAGWVSVTSGSGSGSGSVSFSVAANTVTSTRSTVISVGGQTFTVTQNAP